MRFVVNFAHRKYVHVQEMLRSPPEGFALPLGLYRQLAVVVEATSSREAIERARAELGWPDHEVDLVPVGVMSQAEMTGLSKARRHATDALAQHWQAA